jgi:hypothetical protein
MLGTMLHCRKFRKRRKHFRSFDCGMAMLFSRVDWRMTEISRR